MRDVSAVFKASNARIISDLGTKPSGALLKLVLLSCATLSSAAFMR
jgi:hypothetical protein